MAHRKHEKEIRAWLDGAKIQWRFAGAPWQDIEDDRPDWNPLVEYRVKPVEPEREYPVCHIGGVRLHKKLNEFGGRTDTECKDDMQDLADWILRTECDAGNIVSRAEFDRAIGDRAARDMAVAQGVKDAAYSAVRKCAASHATMVVHGLDLASIISQVK